MTAPNDLLYRASCISSWVDHDEILDRLLFRTTMSSARRRSERRSKSPDMLPGEQPGLRGLVQRRILNDVFQTASGRSRCSASRWRALFKLSSLLDRQVAGLENSRSR